MAGDFLKYCKQLEEFLITCSELGIVEVEYLFGDYEPPASQQRTFLNHLKKSGVITQSTKIEQQIDDIVTKVTLSRRVAHRGYRLTLEPTKVLGHFKRSGLSEQEKTPISLNKEGHVEQSSYGEVGNVVYRPEPGQLPAAILMVLVQEHGKGRLSAKKVAERINADEYLRKSSAVTQTEVTTSINKINKVMEKRLYSNLIVNDKGYYFNSAAFEINIR